MAAVEDKHRQLEQREVRSAVVRFAGDSGDGMQVVGDQFSDNSALAGSDISTFPDYPAEIRAPKGTLPGVSGYQINFGSSRITTPGDAPDALVVMNPAALRVNLSELVPGGLLVVNTGQFSADNLRKANYTSNPLDDPELATKYELIRADITKLTTDALVDSPLKTTEKSRCKNFFALGFMYFVYSRPLDYTIAWIQAKWGKKPDVAAANIAVLKAGYYFGETTETVRTQYVIGRAVVESGTYRKINGNEALALGFIAASERSNIEIVYGSYPITPASDVLKYLAAQKNFPVKTIQAEDEIAAIGMAIGASFAGAIGITATSGPGMCLKSEALGLAIITELPLVVVDVQRGGPSTGLPTKTEQGDLLQAMFGRNSESPVVVIAPDSPGDCFNVAIEAIRIAVKYCTPVIILSDAYNAFSSEPWKIPEVNELPEFSRSLVQPGDRFVIYERNPKTLARRMAIPGTPGFEHQIGGLEKDESGAVCYDPMNHQRMVELRARKVAGIADELPPTVVNGPDHGKLVVLGWGSTYGSITSAIDALNEEGITVSHVHLRYLNPLPRDLGEILARFDKVLLPEMNLGHLAMLIRSRYLIDVVSHHKVQGRPFLISELVSKIKALL